MNNAASFQLKGSVVTAIVLELHQYTPQTFARELQVKVQQAPALFDQSALVINLEKFDADFDSINFITLLEQCRNAGLQPIAFRGGDENLGAAIRATGLAWLPRSGARHKDKVLTNTVAPSPNTERAAETIIETVVEERLVHRPSKVITRPVRSGQQFYAEGADLIVLAQVGEGAEVLADGHIHVYGALRGRALAGVNGDKSARIFCHSLEAELVSIAGTFMLSDELRETSWKLPCHTELSDDKLAIKPI